MQQSFQVFSIEPFELDSIFKEINNNSDSNLKENTSFDEVSKEYEFALPEYSCKLDLEYDQRDDCIKQFDFLMKSDKEINSKTDVSTAYFESKKFSEEVSSQALNKWMILDCQNEIKNQIQILPELSIHESYNCNQSLCDSNGATKNSSRKYARHAIKALTRVSFVEDVGMLNQRRDVINKTCLRIIKKFYKNGVNITSLKSRYLSSYKKGKVFEVLIQNYAENFKSKLIKLLPNESDAEELQIDYIKHALGFIINESFYLSSLKLSKKKADKEIISFCKSFEECCRCYSHKKFEELIKSKLFKYLFVFFADSVDDSFLREITAVNNNLEAYKSAILQIKEILTIV